MFKALILFFATLTCAFAATPELPALNLGSMQQADAFARKIVAHYEAEAKAAGLEPRELDPLLIYHIGREVPEQVKWIMLHLEAAKIPVELALLTDDELQEKLKEAKDGALERSHVVSYDAEAKARASGIKETWESARFLAKRLFGFPKGFTLWVKLDRSKKLKWLEGGMAALGSGLAGASVAIGFYLSERVQAVPAHELRAGLAVATWIWIYLYQARRFSDFMTQSKVLTETAPGTFKATNNRFFTGVTTAMRSLVTNAVILVGAFGLESAFNGYNIQHSLMNSVVSMFARSWVDDWLSLKMPRIRENGTVVVEPEKGHWKLETWIVVNSVWNLVYNFGKNFHLLGLGTEYGTSIVYYVMGAVGLAKVLYIERFDIKNRLQRLAQALRGAGQVEICQSLLIGPRVSPKFIRSRKTY